MHAACVRQHPKMIISQMARQFATAISLTSTPKPANLQLCRLLPRIFRPLPLVFPAPVTMFHTSTGRFGEPLKKKKKQDASVVKAREERKKKKLEKMIKKLEKTVKQPKPINEYRMDAQMQKQLDRRKRPSYAISYEEAERRALLSKAWTRFKQVQSQREHEKIASIVKSQETALEELQKCSQLLYESAIQKDDQLLPFRCRGSTDTPPIDNYKPPDGQFTDFTKVW